MKKSELRVGIVGVGGIASGKHMLNLAKIDNVKMVAFCDTVKERAAKGAEAFGVKGAAIYTDYRQMLEKAELDIVHVCTPNDVHAPISVAALEAGCHVMCEKPMAKTAEGARQMVEAARRTGKKLSIAYQNRYRSDVQYLKQLCDKGGLGEIYFAKALAIRRRAVPTWGVFLDKERQGGGSLIDIGTHALDLTLWLMNNYEPEFAVGSVYYKLNSRKNAANPWGTWDPKKFTAEDSAFGFIKFKNGATVLLESSWALNTLMTGEARCVLCGTEAGADMQDGLRINGDRFGRMWNEKIQLDATGVDFYDGSADNPSEIEQRQWIEAIVKDKEPTVKPEQALVVTEILEGLYTSGATGKPFYFNEAPVLVGAGR